MAKKSSVDQLQEEMGKDVKFKSYANDGKGFYELDENNEVMGVFVSVKDQQITDIRSHEPKIIRVYSLRKEDGTIVKIGSRALLDGLFDDAMDEHGGVIVENKRYSGPGIEWLRNKVVKIVRGSDKKTRAGSMGMYEFLVESDD